MMIDGKTLSIHGEETGGDSRVTGGAMARPNVEQELGRRWGNRYLGQTFAEFFQMLVMVAVPLRC
jgi:hypothetical protein